MTEAWEERLASWEQELETDHEPESGDWVVELVEDLPGYTVYDVNNGVGRTVGYGAVMQRITDRNPEERPIWFLDKDGEYRPW